MCAKISAALEDARRRGYEAYKEKLIRTGLYSEGADERDLANPG